MKNILFVCTGNTCRSPMAQGIMEKISYDNMLGITASSAGIQAVKGQPVSDNAIAVCREIGVDISRYRTTPVSELTLSDYDVIFVMTPYHKHALIAMGANPYKVWLLGAETGGISDPFGGDEDTYRRCRDEIYDAVQAAVKEI